MNSLNHLFLAIQEKKNDEVLKIVDEVGVNVLDNYNRTPIMNAALYGNIELVQALIQKKAALDMKDKIGYTALHFSAQEAHIEVTRLLLENGANPNVMDKHGNTPAWVTITNWKAGKNFDTLRLLIDHKADLTVKNNAGRCTMDLIPPAIREQLRIA